jgi:uncharacterized protein (DUF1330 family)
MKIRHPITVAVAVGLGLTILATYGLAAPTRKAYVVIELDEITDADHFEVLKKMGSQATVEVGVQNGRYLARTENVTALDGTPPKAIVIIAFDNEAKAKAYYDNSKEITAMRTKTTKSRAFIVDVCSDRGKLSQDC